MKHRNYYEILEVSEKATFNQIKRAYYSLSKKYHPDINPKTANLFRNINEAYQVLSDPEKRKEYDQSLLVDNTEETSNYTDEYYTNASYYQDPTKEPIVNILDDFWDYRFENAISAIWKRNIFVLIPNCLLFLFITVCILINDIIKIFNKKGIKSKKSKNVWINYINDAIKENHPFRYICWFIFMFGLSSCKLIYDIAHIAYWIFSRILKYFLIPVAIIIASILHINLPRRQYY